MKLRRRVLGILFGLLQLAVGGRVFWSPDAVAQPMPAHMLMSHAAMPHAGMEHEHGEHEQASGDQQAPEQHDQSAGCHAGPVCCIPVLPMAGGATVCESKTVFGISKTVVATSSELPVSFGEYFLPRATAPPAAR